MASQKGPPASEGEIALHSKLDTLYTHPFKVGQQGEGRYLNVVTLDDGSARVEMELTPRVKISVVFIKEKNDIDSVQITKYRFHRRFGWREDKTESIKLAPITLEKLVGLLQFLSELDLAGIHERRIRLAEDALPEIDAQTKRRIRTLLSQRDGPALIEELLKTDVLSTKDIVNIGYRKAQLKVFDRLLNENGFIAKYKAEERIIQQGSEPAWQRYFEKNPWVFGYGLHYVWCTNLPDAQLEQVVSGFDFGAHGKRVDALLRTAAHLSQFVLVEIKTPDVPLIGSGPRPGVWSPSTAVTDGVAQIQKTVSQFKERYFQKADLTDADGNPLGIEVFNISPKSYLLIGNLSEFRTSAGVNRDKYSSFQLFRGSLKDPEILTFDELYARAVQIVAHGDKA